jgi:hypothetical protein
MITHQAENPENEKYYAAEQEDTTARVKLSSESMMITTATKATVRDTTKTAEPPPNKKENNLKQPQPGYVLAQNFRNPQSDINYVSVGPQSSERELYDSMVEAAVRLNKAFRGVKGMVSKVKICAIKEGAQ